MKQQHHIDRIYNVTTRAVPGRPGVREVVGYRPVEFGVGGPYILDDGPNGGRESPRMTEPIAYQPPSSRTRSSAGRLPPEAPGTVTSNRRRGGGRAD